MYPLQKLTLRTLDTDTITLYSRLQNKHQDTATSTQGLFYQVEWQNASDPVSILLSADPLTSSHHDHVDHHNTREQHKKTQGRAGGNPGIKVATVQKSVVYR